MISCRSLSGSNRDRLMAYVEAKVQELGETAQGTKKVVARQQSRSVGTLIVFDYVGDVLRS